jgi:dihydrofolate reductase
MNSISKIVFSRTLKKAGWNNTRIISGNVAEGVLKLRRLPGKDMVIFGSSNVVSSLMQFNLINEFRIMVNPIILGRGKQLFHDVQVRQNLRLRKTKTFHSGNILLYYQSTRSGSSPSSLICKYGSISLPCSSEHFPLSFQLLEE